MTESDNNDLLTQAVAFHQAHQLMEAQLLYEQLLHFEPHNINALHLLGVCLFQQGNPQDSINLIEQAISINPNIPEFHINAAISLQALNQYEQAASHLQQVIALNPHHDQAYFMLGNVYATQQKYHESIVAYESAININSHHAETRKNLGRVFQTLKMYDKAIDQYKIFLAQYPDDVDVNSYIAISLQSSDRFSEALTFYEKIIPKRQHHMPTYSNMGICFQKLHKHEEALKKYDVVLSVRSDDINTLINKSYSLIKLNRHEEALININKALKIQPNNIDALVHCGFILFNLKQYEQSLLMIEEVLRIETNHMDALNIQGNVLGELKRYKEALISFEKSLAIQPDNTDTLNNYGNILYKLKRYDEAITSYEKATHLKPDFAAANWNESACRLSIGDYDRGWEKFEWRWQTLQAHRRRHFIQPLWLGKESLDNKTILLYAEEGFGDIIHFVRYIKKVADLGAFVILWVPSCLKSLMENIDGVGQIYAFDEPLPHFDYQCPLMSLPLAFQTNAETIPNNIPYLFSDTSLTKKWEAKLSKISRPRVGIVCWSSINSPELSCRYITLEKLVSAIMPHASCVLLQKEINQADKKTLALYPELLHAGKELCDFSDTASLIENMDLVISIDSCVAHLAGAMGKPVWVLLPFHADWRWLSNREDSPWYPTMHLFRQQKEDDWNFVLEQIKTELASLKF